MLLGLFVLLVGALAVLTRVAAHGRVLTAAQAPARDVAVILGAQVYPDGRPSRYLRARLDLGVRLFREGKARLLVVSGDNSPEHNNETTAMRRYLEARGVPSDRIVEDTRGVDTYATCVRLAREFGVREALLVSQRYHLTRAVATCRAIGLDAVGVGDVSVKGPSRRWDYFALRELGANVKLALDLILRREV